MTKKVAYLFPGQGSQYVGMGQDLYDSYDEAKEVFDLANEMLSFDLKNICFKGPQEELQKTRYAQIAIFTTSMAALKVFEARFKKSDEEVVFAAGLSLGEATALTAAEVFSLEEGIEFVKNRGLYMDEASIESPGTMAAVLGIELDVAERICNETGAEVGNLNCPGQIVISGKKDAVAAAIPKFEEAGARRCMPLDVSGAFHSSCMDSACEKIKKALERVDLKTPKYSVVSNLTARPEEVVGKIKENLVHQMNHRTLWEDSMRFMIQSGVGSFYEVGPGRVLKGLMKKIDRNVPVVSVGALDDIQILTEETNAA